MINDWYRGNWYKSKGKESRGNLCICLGKDGKGRIRVFDATLWRYAVDNGGVSEKPYLRDYEPSVFKTCYTGPWEPDSYNPSEMYHVDTGNVIGDLVRHYSDILTAMVR